MWLQVSVAPGAASTKALCTSVSCVSCHDDDGYMFVRIALKWSDVRVRCMQEQGVGG